MNDARQWERLDGRPGGVTRAPLAVATSALLIIDVQRYWTAPEGPLGASLRQSFPDMFAYFHDRLRDSVRPNIAALLSGYRAAGLPVIHVVTGSAAAGGADLLPHMRRRFSRGGAAGGGFHSLRVGSEWYEPDEAASPSADEVIVHKTTRSAFTSTGIDQVLRNMGVTQLVVCGLATNACVQATAVDGADRGYETFLVEDCCVTFDPQAHAQTLDNFHWIFGTVVRAGDIQRALEQRNG